MYTKERDDIGRWWLVEPGGDYIVDVPNEEVADILLSHLNRN